MAFVDDILSVLLGITIVLLLSLYTLANCRAQLTSRPATYEAFLFAGGSRRQSLAGTLGYAFSLTYYGATIIYGHLYGAWFPLFLGVVLLIAIGLTRRVVRLAEVTAAATGNLLLDWLRHRLGDDQAQHVFRVYALIYFALLIEELAVSRLVLQTLFPMHSVITAVVLATICVVILAYLKWGGFRAVLIADYEQLKMLFPFVLVVAFLVFRVLDEVDVPRDPFVVLVPGNPFTVLGGASMLAAWIVGSVDFYARLNYTPSRSRVGFATLALTLAGIIFMIGACYGMLLPMEFSTEMTPEGFTKGGVQIAGKIGIRMGAAILFASLFCMIFTTINTLLITLFQLGYYRRHGQPHIGRIHRVFLWAILLSAIVRPNAVSAFGLFICALMIVPFIVICGASFPRLAPLLSGEIWYVWPAIGLATLLFGLTFEFFETNYAQMPLLGGIVVVSTLVAATAAWLARTGIARYGR